LLTALLVAAKVARLATSIILADTAVGSPE
jgi:hypothetical protein